MHLPSASDPTPADPGPAATSAPTPAHRSRWRHLLAGGVAGAVLATGLGGVVLAGYHHSTAAATDQSAQTSPQTSAPATTPVPDRATTLQQLPGYGSSGSGPGQGGLGYPGGALTPPEQPDGTGTTGGATTDVATATDATDEQSRGLVLIDTVLPEGEAAGTGMILDADGTVLTNYHVVEGSTSITVTDAVSGTTYDATVVGHDASADVALLQLDDASGLTPITVDDDDPSVADPVTAVGNAEGQGYLSASTGTVQALGRSITTGDSAVAAGEALSDLIQVDASVVGGYSGGALLDEEGEVVGITTAASSSVQVAEAYAVPIQDALDVVDQIESGTETAEVEIGPAAYLGVQITDSLQIVAVEDDTPAADAGLVAGDTITALDGTAVAGGADLSAVLAGLEPGDTVALRWTDASGAAQQSRVTLGASPIS